MISVLKFALKFPPLRFVLNVTIGIMAFCLHCLRKKKQGKKQQNTGVIELKNYNIFIFDISAEIRIHLEVSPTLFCVKCHKRHKGILPTLLRKKKRKKRTKQNTGVIELKNYNTFIPLDPSTSSSRHKLL